MIQVSKVKILNDIFAKILPRMKKVMMVLIAAAVIIAAAAGASSCEKYVLPELSLSKDTLAVNKAAQELTFVVNANVPWEFDLSEVKAEWLVFSPEWGDLGMPVTISIEENTTGARRSVTVPVSSQTITKNLLIVQSADDAVPEL